MNNRDFGAFGENMAALYLENNGYRILVPQLQMQMRRIGYNCIKR